LKARIPAKKGDVWPSFFVTPGFFWRYLINKEVMVVDVV
jgi:hypothetical protein